MGGENRNNGLKHLIKTNLFESRTPLGTWFTIFFLILKLFICSDKSNIDNGDKRKILQNIKFAL